jgi:hypothetical protein
MLSDRDSAQRTLSNMQGINRLGKGPAKPGTMRPADPNKYKTMDIFSEGTEGDKDYARMVQDVSVTSPNVSTRPPIIVLQVVSSSKFVSSKNCDGAEQVPALY